jgi:putative PEP-CTERM system TPR-repeat lipoprotein
MLNSKTLFRSVFILASFLAIGACDETTRYTDQELLQRAKDFQAQGKFDYAVIELKNAVQKNPKNAEARLRLGEMYIELGMGDPAEAELKRAKALGMDEEALRVPMGQALLAQGLYKRVMEEIKPGPKSPSGNIPKILEIQARAQIGMRRFDEGCKLFAQSIEMDAQYIPSYWGLARCTAARGNLDEARTELYRALRLDNKNSGTWTQIADLERAAHRLPEAEAAYDNALKYKNGNFDALLGRAFLKIDINKLNDAKQDIDVAYKAHKDNPVVNHLRGIIQFKQQQFADAKTSFQTALRANPDYLPAVLWLGLTNFAEADYEQAARQFAQYTRSFPDTNANALLALAQARLGRSSDAEQTLKVLRNVDVKDPQSLALLAQAHMSLGDTDLAAVYLTKAVEQKPGAVDLRVALAETLAQEGDNTHAIEQLENAVRLDPGMVNADILLIQSLVRDKQFDKALAEVEALEKKQPKNAAIINLKGTIYLAKDDIANARKSFEQALGLEVPSVAAALNLAQLDLLEKDPEAARQRLEGVLAKDKTNVQAMMGLAAIAAATSQESEYVAWLEKAAKAGPSVARPRMLLASYYLQKNEARKALALAGQAQIAEPNNFQTLDLLGTAQLAAGEKENAVITYSKLASLFPKSPVAQFKLASAQLATNNIDGMRISLKNALALKPDYIDAEILLGSAELGTGRYVEALQIALQLQQKYPKSASGFVLQGDILMAQKQFGPALKAYEKAMAMSNNGLVAVKMHRALSGGGNAKEADARLLQWLKGQPGDLNARAYLAATYMVAGQNKQAIEQYQLMLQTDPKNIGALNDLAWLYQKEKDPRALATAEQAYQLKPDNPEIMDTLGWILVEQNNTTRGTELLQKATVLSPTSTMIRYHWAAALAKSGDKAQARRELADLLTKNKTFPERLQAQELLRQL